MTTLLADTTLRIPVDGATAAWLDQHATVSPEHLAAQLLQWCRLSLHNPRAHHIVVSGDDLHTLETILSGGSVLNGADLVQKVERLAGISFEHCRISFTPGQLEDLARRAASNGLTPKELIERTAPRIYEQFFNLLGG